MLFNILDVHNIYIYGTEYTALNSQQIFRVDICSFCSFAVWVGGGWEERRS